MQSILLEHKKKNLIKTGTEIGERFWTECVAKLQTLQTGNNTIREYNKMHTEITKHLRRCKSKSTKSVIFPSYNVSGAMKEVSDTLNHT